MAASNSRRIEREGKILVERDTMYEGKLRREMRAKIIVVRDFSVHSVER